MRKSLVAALITIGGGATYAAGVTEIARDLSMDDSSMWRWRVTSILAEQSQAAGRGDMAGILDANAFAQRYERFTPLGLPQTRSYRR